MQQIPLYLKAIIPVAVFILMQIKPLGIWLKTVCTFFHETSHALTALLLGNKVKNIELHDTTSGVCTSTSKSKFKTFLTSLAGYSFCSFIPLVIIFVINNRYVQTSFLILAVFTFLNIILYIRGGYALVWSMVFACINLLLYWLPLSGAALIYVLYCYLWIVAIDNTASCTDLLKCALQKPKQSGDCANLQKITGIPAFLWAVIFFTINIIALYFALKEIFQIKIL